MLRHYHRDTAATSAPRGLAPGVACFFEIRFFDTHYTDRHRSAHVLHSGFVGFSSYFDTPFAEFQLIPATMLLDDTQTWALCSFVIAVAMSLYGYSKKSLNVRPSLV
jgi:hypothetical protein